MKFLSSTFLFLLLTLFFGVSTALRAQPLKPPAPQLLLANYHTHNDTHDAVRNKIVDMSIKNNPSIRQFELLKKQARVLKKTAVNLPNPALTADFYNNKKLRDFGFQNGTVFSLTETFNFPTAYVARGQMLTSQYALSETNVEIIKKRVAKQADQLYNEYLFAAMKRRAYEHYDSLFKTLRKISSAEYRAGAITDLSRMNLGAKQRQIYNLYQTAIIEEERMRDNLYAFLLDSTHSTQFDLQKDSLYERRIDWQVAIENNPSSLIVKQAQQNVQLMQKTKKYVWQQQYLPSIVLGARYDATIVQQAGLWAPTIGLSIPLFFWTNYAEVKSAKLQYQSEQQRAAQTQLNVKIWNQNLMASFRNVYREIHYYQDESLPQIIKMRASANASYKAGSITVLEYLFIISQVIDMELLYYDVLRRYNNIVSQIIYGGLE